MLKNKHFCPVQHGPFFKLHLGLPVLTSTHWCQWFAVIISIYCKLSTVNQLTHANMRNTHSVWRRLHRLWIFNLLSSLYLWCCITSDNDKQFWLIQLNLHPHGNGD